MLFTNQGGLWCWNVADDRLVWQYEASGRSQDGYYSHTVCHFAADVINEGRAVIIAICLSLSAPLCVHTSLLQMSMLREVCSTKFADIVHLDLIHGISYSIFPHDYFTVNEVAHTLSVKICSDFVAFLLRYSSEDKIYLAKLSTQSCRIIEMEVSFNVLVWYFISSIIYSHTA